VPPERSPLAEVFAALDDAFERLGLCSPLIVNTLQGGGNEGMLLLERHLAELVRTKRITRETALAAANDPGALAYYLRRAD